MPTAALGLWADRKSNRKQLECFQHGNIRRSSSFKMVILAAVRKTEGTKAGVFVCMHVLGWDMGGELALIPCSLETPPPENPEGHM